MKNGISLRGAWRSPLVTVVIIGLAILSVEFMIMLLFDQNPALLGNTLSNDVLDPLLLALLVSPLLYWLVLRPMRFQQTELLRNQAQLLDMNINLEQRVLERTRELRDTQSRLERDIAERRRIEASLRRHKEMLIEAQQLAHLGSWDLDLVTNHLVWSDEAFRIFEFDPAYRDASYETFLALVHPDDRECVNHAYTTSVKEKSTYDIVHRLLFSDGRVKWVHERCNTFYAADGKPLRSIGTTHDITEYQKTQEMLRKLSIAVEQSPASVIITDLDANIEYVNSRFTEVTGYTAAEVIGQNARVLQSGQTSKESYLSMWETLASGKTWHGDFFNKRKNGELYWEESQIAPVKDSAGVVTHYVAIKTDITARKAMEEELRNYNDELEEINRQLHDAQAHLLQSEKMASIGQLAAGVAHEINNPIGFVHSNLGSLEHYLKDLFEILDVYERTEATMPQTSLAEVRRAKQQKELAFLRQDVPELMSESKDGLTRVKKIIQDLKEFSHVGDSDEWQWADLHSGLDSTIGIVWNEIKYHAQVVKEYGDLPEVECLPSELNQVFMNILVNAAHAIDSRGFITIRTGLRGEEVFVQISDNGRGISPENLKRIFDPFFTTKPVGKGTGLGLSLSFGIAQKHHGRIEVQSEVDSGTTFTLCLPVKHQVQNPESFTDKTTQFPLSDKTLAVIDQKQEL